MVMTEQLTVLAQDVDIGTLGFRLDEIPQQPNRETFKFLLNPAHPDAALNAVRAIYSYLFWEDGAGNNPEKLNAALSDKDSLIRWVKDRADKGLTVFDDLIEMAKRANLLYQVSYARSGMQFHPDENEDAYEHFSDLLRNKLGETKSTGEKSELAWAAEELVPLMQSKGLDLVPLIGREDFYTKFRHWAQSIRQRDRVMEAADRRWEAAKKQAAQKLLQAGDPAEEEVLQKDLLRIIEQENLSKGDLLQDYETAIRDGFMDIVNPQTTVRQIDEKWKRGNQPPDNLGKGIGYTALISQQKTLLIAEFDYSILNPLETAIETMIDVRGMTDPMLIIQQLRDFADGIEKTIGGK
jgi:hypothetical protein